MDWEVSSSPIFKKRTILDSGTTSTSQDRDWTVKAIPEGLQSGEDYYYRFEVDGVISPVGHASTLPEQAPSVRMAVLSCANFTNTEFFETYRRSRKLMLNSPMTLFWVNIYEYGLKCHRSVESV